MKKQILILATLVLSMNIFMVQGQAVFSVKPGLNLNGATFGVNGKKLQPFIGLRFASVKFTSEYHDANYPANDYKDETRLNIYMPNIGAKLYLSGSEVIKPYLQLALYKPIIFGKQLQDGTENQAFKDNLNNIKVWAGEFGFGTEYFLHPQFSLGGEFGLRVGNVKDKYESQDQTTTSTDKVGLGISYVSFSLNYYFTKREN